MSDSEQDRTALENALFENPDDLGAHHAYADCLMEQGDPRGELIQVQLALEDEDRSAENRRLLKRREQELLKAHEEEWLGELAPYLLGTRGELLKLFSAEMLDENRLEYTTGDVHFRHSWCRGWLSRFECDNIGVEMCRKLGQAPIARLLRGLVCRGGEGAGVFRFKAGTDLPNDNPNRFHPCEILAHNPVVKNLRLFQYGEEVDEEADRYDSGTQFEQLAPLIRSMPRLEELYIYGHIYGREAGDPDISAIFSSPTLSNLRILQYYHGHAYPFEALANNPHLQNLTHLLCFPHSFSTTRNVYRRILPGETIINRQRVKALVESPHLTGLTHLQLRICDAGDAMIDDIVHSGILKRLKVLDLRHGHITDKGARRLASTPAISNLELLDLCNNRLTNDGIEALRGRPRRVKLRAENQQTEPYNDDIILYCGDTE